MAVYYCHHCDNYKDDDWHPCEEDPERPLELICPDCAAERQERIEEARERLKQPEGASDGT